ncbi:hypothetical protein C8C77_12938 [Halanaerobium saccharolyticum]|uniref:ABC transporter domain-containing protein n=1 Tax=Halanaerobium saccharolyticum TaxID=43595 RepID=A0A4R7YXE6_9FIRM|nr:hypothetical protein [Halanaerobium saccharolyticum]RAK05458.1 hypothetical protein C7958_12638 [Halanaerobium saccharolyticum]TDV99793.1 hypothetical protein C8C77_12938 [Halanaerobium saccharolyticum]TDX52015.1 hypothetical protein C7956_12838 [Halanaerobium saccharolyticum]
MEQNILEIKNLKFEEQPKNTYFNLKVQKNSIHSILFKNDKLKKQLLDFLIGEKVEVEAELNYQGTLLKPSVIKNLYQDQIFLINQYSAVNPDKDPLGIFKFNKKGEGENKSTVFPEMTIAENIFFGREPLKKFLFFKSIDNQKMIEKTAELLELLEVELYPDQKMLELSPLEKQLVELLKTLSCGAEIILIDQAVIELSESEKQIFFDFMQQLKQKGITIIYFTKEIEEVFAVSDFVSVLKEEQNKGTRKVSELEYNELALLLMGK